ncbi:MAG: SPOR domain-containing protein, partial [Candidatus Brocadiia bacterium]
ADILLLASDYTSAKSGYEKAVEGCSDGRLLFLLGARLCAAAFLAGDSAKADEYYSAWTRDFGELTASFSGASSVANKLKTDLSGSSPFCVQVGVFGNPDRANALVKTLTAAGYVASVKQTEQGYRVLVGPYDAVRHAEEAARKLQSEGYSTILKPWDGR